MKVQLFNTSMVLFLSLIGACLSMEKGNLSTSHLKGDHLPSEIKVSVENRVFAPATLSRPLIEQMWEKQPRAYMGLKATRSRFLGEFQWRGIKYKVVGGEQNIVDPHYEWVDAGIVFDAQIKNIEPLLVNGFQTSIGSIIFGRLIYKNVSERTGAFSSILSSAYDPLCIEIQYELPSAQLAQIILGSHRAELQLAQKILDIEKETDITTIDPRAIITKFMHNKTAMHNRGLTTRINVDWEILNITGAFNYIEMFLTSYTYWQMASDLQAKGTKLAEKEIEVKHLEDQVAELRGQVPARTRTFAIEAAEAQKEMIRKKEQKESK